MPTYKHVLADLDVLNEDALTCVIHCPDPSAKLRLAPLNAVALTNFVKKWGGNFESMCGASFYLMPEDMERFRAAGWDVRAKSEPNDQLLEELLWKNLSENDYEPGWFSSKTLVLVGSELSDSLRRLVEMHLESGWRVRFYSFNPRGARMSVRLKEKYPSSFENKYLDGVDWELMRTGDVESIGRPLSDVNRVGNDRFVFVDVDPIGARLAELPGYRVNVDLLTKMLCGADRTKVQRQVATYRRWHDEAGKKALLANGWVLNRIFNRSTDQVQLNLLYTLIHCPFDTAVPKTVVLAVDVDALPADEYGLLHRLLIRFMSRRWYIELYTHALDGHPDLLAIIEAHQHQICWRTFDNLFADFSNLRTKRLSTSSERSAASLRVAPDISGNQNSATTNATSRQELEQLYRESFKLESALDAISRKTARQLQEMEDFYCDLLGKWDILSDEGCIQGVDHHSLENASYNPS